MFGLTLAELVGFVGFALNVWGNLALTSKSTHGWTIRIASNLCWGAYGFGSASWPNLVNAATFFGINCYGLWRWTREAKKGAST